MNDYDLPQWEHPRDYGGFSPDGDYLIAAQNRDSDALERSNFDRIKADLEAFDERLQSDDCEYYVYTFTANHWAVGWVEYLLIKQDAPDALQRQAYEILGALSDYPVYDESHFSELEFNEASEYWEQLPVSERVELCQRFNCNIFSARHDWIPRDDNGCLFDYLRTP